MPRHDLSRQQRTLTRVGWAVGALCALTLTLIGLSATHTLSVYHTTSSTPTVPPMNSATATAISIELTERATNFDTLNGDLLALTSAALAPKEQLTRSYIEPTTGEVDLTVSLSPDAGKTSDERLQTSEQRAFAILRTVYVSWTHASDRPITRVVLVLWGPSPSGSDSTPYTLYAQVELSASHAASLDWDHASAQSAWPFYDAITLYDPLKG